MRNETILFASDLDNTLLFSHQHAQAGDVCVEYLDGKAQGFFRPASSGAWRTSTGRCALSR